MINLRLKNPPLAEQGQDMRGDHIHDFTAIENEVNRLAAEADALAVSITELWVSGTTYALDKLVISPITGRTYKRIIAGAGTTDPSADGTNWQLVNLGEFVAQDINTATAATPADAAKFGFWDSVTNAFRSITLANFKATLLTYFQTLFGHPSDNPWARMGECLFDQRYAGAAITITAGASAAKTIDGWRVSCTGANVTAQRAAGSGEFQKCLQVTGAASVTGITAMARCHGEDVARFLNLISTVGINISNSLLTTATWKISYANSLNNFGAVTQIATGSLTVGASDARYTFQVPANANVANGLQIEFSVGAQTSGTFKVTGLDQVPGAFGRPYPHLTKGKVRFLCQEVYEKSYDDEVVPGTSTQVGLVYAGGMTASAGEKSMRVSFKVTKRGTPTISLWDSIGNVGKISTFDLPAATVTHNVTPSGTVATSINSMSVYLSATTYSGMMFHWSADTEL
ncbi:MAG TPA: hypothetical protein VK149_03535 [Sideroxyarcus sp.]|nr:hypothetical protein [Sideroxyarcus sp.]